MKILDGLIEKRQMIELVHSSSARKWLTIPSDLQAQRHGPLISAPASEGKRRLGVPISLAGRSGRVFGAFDAPTQDTSEGASEASAGVEAKTKLRLSFDCARFARSAQDDKSLSR